ncbi:hypothetical protein P0E69_15525 [Chimaeribacter arupi]|uniref:hypothetical protein n=1 Tax=Chimaeribacter arupi TaxID=2060066 RepID=UPI002711D80E|nr:hypothetical protein [Chimaeribacter arupi]WKZ91597.1 hypothetical protein P0E69_15525 [Chimaeribacter arupi]
MALDYVTGVSSLKIWTEPSSEDISTAHLVVNGRHYVTLYAGVKFKTESGKPAPTPEQCEKEVTINLINNVTGNAIAYLGAPAKDADLFGALYNPNQLYQATYAEDPSNNYDWVISWKLCSNKTINPNFASEAVALQMDFVGKDNVKISMDTSASGSGSTKTSVQVVCHAPQNYQHGPQNNTQMVTMSRDNGVANFAWDEMKNKKPVFDRDFNTTDYDDFVYRMHIQSDYFTITRFEVVSGTRLKKVSGDDQLFMNSSISGAPQWDHLQNVFCPTITQGLGQKNYDIVAYSDDKVSVTECRHVGKHSGKIYQGAGEIIFYAAHITANFKFGTYREGEHSYFYLWDQFGTKMHVEVVHTMKDHDAVPGVSNVQNIDN